MTPHPLEHTLASLLKFWPNYQLPPLTFDGKQWIIDSDGVLVGATTILGCLYAYCEGAKALTEDVHQWDKPLAFLDGYAGPLDLTLVTTPNHQPEDWSGL